ncbi:protein phosphatase inhibitor 2-like [Fukomys damarensis]|uniref:Protein phosphatase inhibitor 2 n=1 Tax=Fukomys damarensis TaxID=885580 RepID=A0A091CNK0_FUKDA|nr:protein phosphatase inhibitor 2-like [Fukomys damarensis]KFO19577.1 Protein phosphatase inhibitor 2 [Fukomys damarensis]
MSQKPDPPAGDSTASPRPIKGILKNKTAGTSSSVVGSTEESRRIVKSQRWDEMNILATQYAAAIDYVDESSTTSLNIVDNYEDTGMDIELTQALTPDVSAKQSAAAEGSESNYQTLEQESGAREDHDHSPPQIKGKKSND